MHTRGSKSGVKNETPKLPETRESLGKIGIFLLLNSAFPHTKFDFLQRLSAFREIQENLLQRLSAFFNGFPLFQWVSIFFNGFLISSTAFQFSSTAFRFSSTAFLFPRNPIKIYLRRQVYERSLFELCVSCHLLPKLCNSR